MKGILNLSRKSKILAKFVTRNNSQKLLLQIHDKRIEAYFKLLT